MGRVRTPFARVGADTNRAELEAGIVTTRAAVLHALMQRMERTEGGDVLVSRPRAEVAEELGVTPEAVRAATRALVRGGWLEVVGPGHSGHATVYRLTLPCGVLADGGDERKGGHA